MNKILVGFIAVVILGSSIFIPSPISEASTISKAEAMVKIAERNAGALKWQISYEVTKEIKHPDMIVFNLTKNAYLQAKNEIAQINTQEKVILEKRLEENVGIYYKRAMGYIDALTSGTKIIDMTKQYNTLYNENSLANETEESYHKLSSEIRKQAILLYRVYGKSTRDAILIKYKTPAETALVSTQHVITTKMHLDSLNRLISDDATQLSIETQVGKFFTSLELIEEEKLIDTFYNSYFESIRQNSDFLMQEQEINEFFGRFVTYANDENLGQLLGLYSQVYPNYGNLRFEFGDSFNNYDIKYETTSLSIQYIINGTALVVHEQKSIVNQTNLTESLTPYLLQKDDFGHWKFVDYFTFD